MKIPDAKAAVDKEWKKLETTAACQWRKVKSKKEVILEAQRDKRKVQFATLMDICHLKNAELGPKLPKYKGRVVLRGDIVHLPDCYGRENSRKLYWNLDGKSTELEMHVCSSKTKLFLPVNVDDISMDVRKQNMDPMKNLMKLVDFGEPTSFIDYVYLEMHST